MLDKLSNRYRQATSEIGRSVLAVGVAAGVIILLVTGANDMGLDSEITNNRIVVWLSTAGLALLFGLGYEIYSLTSWLNEKSDTLTEVRSDNESLRKELEDLQDERDSAFRMMKEYRSKAYNDVLSNLYLVVSALKEKESWINKEAKVIQVSINSVNTDEYLSLPERISELSKIHINIGYNDGVIEDMRFKVVDTSRTVNYGRIIVDEVGDTGSICSLTEGFENPLWSELRDCIKNDESKVIDIRDNCILPVIPNEIENVEYGELEDLRKAIEYISE